MIQKSFSSTTLPLHKSFITPFTLHNKIPHTSSIYHHQLNPFKSSKLSTFGFKRYCPRKQSPLLPLLASKGSNDGDNKAMETVLRFYEAIKNKKLNEVSEIIEHDCLCICSFISTFQTFRGKKVRHVIFIISYKFLWCFHIIFLWNPMLQLYCFCIYIDETHKIKILYG